jgi:hypothetical protein
VLITGADSGIGGAVAQPPSPALRVDRPRAHDRRVQFPAPAFCQVRAASTGGATFGVARQNEHQRQTGNAHVLHAGTPVLFGSDYYEHFLYGHGQ